MTSVNRTGSVSRSGKCGAISVGMLLRRQDERAGHLAMKCKWSSGSEWQSWGGLVGNGCFWIGSGWHHSRDKIVSSPDTKFFAHALRPC